MPGPCGADLILGPVQFQPFLSPEKCAPELCVSVPGQGAPHMAGAVSLLPDSALAQAWYLISQEREAGGCLETGCYRRSQPTVSRSHWPGAG